jgi:hypothetical protein
MTDDVERQEIHQRQIDIRFFHRADGLFEVEGRLVDRKTHPFRRLLHDADTPAGAPLHDIRVRLVIDESLLVHEASAALSASPFDVCRGAANTLAPQRLARMAQQGSAEQQSKIDSCFAYGKDREVVARLWPNLRKQTD